MSQFNFSLQKTVEIRMMGQSVENKYVFLHLEYKVCRAGHLCKTLVLHYNAVLSQILSSSKKLKVSEIRVLGPLATLGFQ